MKTRKKILYCYIISTLMYASETWVINAADWKRIEAFEMWAAGAKKNEEVMKLANHKRTI